MATIVGTGTRGVAAPSLKTLMGCVDDHFAPIVAGPGEWGASRKRTLCRRLNPQLARHVVSMVAGAPDQRSL